MGMRGRKKWVGILIVVLNATFLLPCAGAAEWFGFDHFLDVKE